MSSAADVPATPGASSQSVERARSAVHSLSLVLGALPDSLASSEDPAAALLRDGDIARDVTLRLRRAGSGVGDDNLCRWLYDTFQSTLPELQLVVLKFVPTLAGVYLSRAVSRKPLAGFEAVILALYAHQTVHRCNEPDTVLLPNMTNPSVYHEVKVPTKSKAVELDIAVVSPTLEPHGTMRSTRRARIVGVALELYYSKISHMPLSSKLEFCEFCIAWAGQDCKLDEKTQITSASESDDKQTDQEESKEGRSEVNSTGEKWRRVPLPWELFQPALRIVGHCLLGPTYSEELKAQASQAAQSLHWRATESIDARAVLASGSLVRLAKMGEEPIREPSFSGSVGDISELEAMRANILAMKN